MICLDVVVIALFMVISVMVSAIMLNPEDDRHHLIMFIVMSLVLYHCTMGKLQWEVGNRNFSFLREKYIWNIWTRIKWEAKLTNLSEIFRRC